MINLEIFVEEDLMNTPVSFGFTGLLETSGSSEKVAPFWAASLEGSGPELRCSNRVRDPARGKKYI